MSRAWILSVMALAVLSGACGSEDPPTAMDAEELVEMLAGAVDGDTVRVGPGRFEGSFEVPPGVDLRGAGRSETTLVGVEGEPVLVVRPGSTATRVSHLTVETGLRSFPDDEGTMVDGELVFSAEEAEIGILALGSGRVILESVDVDVAYGIGVGAQDVDSMTIRAVNVNGPVTERNAPRWMLKVQAFVPQNSPVSGLVLLSVAGASVEDLAVEGFASSGVQLADTSIDWSGGRVAGNMGTSILVAGGRANLEEIQVMEMLSGDSVYPPYGVAITRDSDVTTTGLTISGSLAGESVGMLQDSARSVHGGLVVTGNEGIGVQIQRCPGTFERPSFRIESTGNDLSGNAIVGLVALQSSGIDIGDVTIEGTVAKPAIIGENVVEIGDGIQIRRCLEIDGSCGADVTDVRLARVVLDRNERAAFVLEAQDASVSGVEVVDVEIGEGGQYGAVTQNAEDLPVGWDALVRTGAEDTLETVQGVDPHILPVASEGSLEDLLN